MVVFFFQAEDGIRDYKVTGVQTCALPICTAELASFLPEEHPIALQLLGGDPDVLAEAARRLEATGADAIDLNMGCPVAKIVSKGHGAALMRDPLTAAVVLRTMRKAVQGALTI